MNYEMRKFDDMFISKATQSNCVVYITAWVPGL